VPDEQALFQIGQSCSATERNSQAAENELRTYLVLELLSTLLGQDFDATVTGMSSGGVFMQLNHYLIDGFIRVADLPSASNDHWRLNRTTGSLVAQRSGKTISIGDRFTVRIAKVTPATRQLDLVIIDKAGSQGAHSKQEDKRRRPDKSKARKKGMGRPAESGEGPAGASKAKSHKKKFTPRKKPRRKPG
jgi:ribonuclease R